MKSLLELLETYTPYDELETLHVQQLRQFLSEGSNHYDRSNLLGHIAADAWIVNPTRDAVVLIEHGLNKLWMAPGGHCDGSADVFAAAVREVEEEIGLTDLKSLLDGAIFDINVGTVPTREKNGRLEPAHLHFDVCFAFEAPHNAPLTISNESTGLRWVPLVELSSIPTAPSHYRRPLKTPALTV
jgi:8-oxo-dGTP pyrophosphatase MutT (NUDIX family)